MRKVEMEMVQAVKAKRDFTKGNTSVYFENTGNPHGTRSEIYLHGNHIADYWHDSGTVDIDERTLNRWPTRTTVSRLNALGCNVRIKNGNPIIGE